MDQDEQDMTLNESTDGQLDVIHLILGIGGVFVLATPFLPLYWIEFEQAISGGGMATVLWGLQFWQSYIVVGMLVLGFLLKEIRIKGVRIPFLIASMMIFLTLVLMMSAPLTGIGAPLANISVPIHSTRYFFTRFIPLIGGMLLMVAIFLSKPAETLLIRSHDFFAGFLLSVLLLLCSVFLSFMFCC